MGRSAAASPVSLGDDKEEGDRLPDLRATINPMEVLRIVSHTSRRHYQLGERQL